MEEKRITEEIANEMRAFIAANSTTIPVPKPVAPPKRMTYTARAELTTNPLSKRLLTLMDEKKSNLCLAVDTEDPEKLLSIANVLGPLICMLKTHVDILTTFPSDFADRIRALADQYRFIVFEDRKFADIGNTVKQQFSAGVYRMSSWCDATNAHALPGDGILEGLKAARPENPHGVFLLAQMSSKGSLCTPQYTDAVVAMAQRHPDSVCGFISQSSLAPNTGLVHCTPGVQLKTGTDALGQQYNTPAVAIGTRGADVIIVGRGITNAPDQIMETLKFKEAGWEAYLSATGQR